MSTSVSRRQFIFGLGAVAAATALPSDAFGGLAAAPLYPPADLSYFNHPIAPAAADIRLGYASITWGGNDLQAMKDIAEVGFRGIQLRSNIVPEYAEKPQALKQLLAEHRLEMVALSSGGVRIGAGTEADEIAKHARHAKFVADVGGRYLQVTDSARPKDRQPTADEFKQLAKVMTEIGKRSVDLGVPLGYHNHMNSLGEAPGEVDQILEAADPRYVKLELDVAHYHQGGGDSAKAIRKYRDRLLFLHIKDVESPVPAAAGEQARAYRFVELGRGKVDLPSVFKALKEVKFRGWAVVELDSVPDKARTPKESALISKKYLEEKLGMKV
ncbi:MAG TPA: TIM barrel protein [Pyrinomonadaceae bacterium]|nr:TIM barrel protein [Pyrinomonadaceae bacterium]